MMNFRYKFIWAQRSVGPLLAACLCATAIASGKNDVAESRVRNARMDWQERALTFESNLGQYESAARFVARGRKYYLALSPTEVRVTVQKQTRIEREDRIGRMGDVATDYRALRIELLGANLEAQMTGDGPADVYPGINLLHYGQQQQLEYDFEISPGADPSVIAMRFHGADKLRIEANSGDLLVTLGAEELRQPKPVIYQIVRGERKFIPGGYVLSDALTVKFALGDYDPGLPLVIDPVVSYSKIFGGPNDDTFWAIALDDDGNVYIAGETLTPGLATAGAFQTNLAGSLAGHGDVIVVKRNNQLTATNYITYLGGNAFEAAFGLAVDGAGNAYVTGYTSSTNFPTRSPIQTNISGTIPPGYTVPPLDLFITKILPSGSNLVFSTFYGGADDDIGQAIALDANTNIFVVGQTISTNFPTSGAVNTNLNGLEDAFILKLGPAGTNVIYATYLGGSSRDIARDVAVNLAGNPVIAGYTSSTNFPVTTNATQLLFNNTTNISANDDAFLCELAANTPTVIYGTYLGGTNSDRAIRLSLDSAGAAYLAGWTLSGDFPRTSTNFSSVIISNTTYADVCVTKLVPGSTNLAYSIVFGGSAREQAWDVAVDQFGNASVVGETASLDFPTNSISGILEGVNSGGRDVFIAQINSNGTAFNYAAYLGSEAEDVGYGVAVEPMGNAYFVGRTASANFPTQSDVGYAPFSDRAAFVVKILANAAPSLILSSSGSTNVTLSWSGIAPEYKLQTVTNLVTTNNWVTLANTPVISNQQTFVTLPATNGAQFFRLIRQ
jgi:hypothetical protein